MITNGTIQSIGRGLSGGFTVTLNLPEAHLPDLKKIETESLLIEMKKARKPRSHEANAYFHVLVGKMAKALNISAANVKNRMIGSYGQPEYLDGKLALITTQIEPENMCEQEFLHTVLVDTRPIKNKVFYTYRVQRGSHTYNTEEMAQLIDGTVEEAKALDIETLPPDEIAKMEAAWKGTSKC